MLLTVGIYKPMHIFIFLKGWAIEKLSKIVMMKEEGIKNLSAELGIGMRVNK
jgi:hypothetical protein